MRPDRNFPWSYGETAARLDAPEAESPDDASIDEAAREQEIRKYQELVQSLPDLRQQRIEELKQQIARGEYRIDSRKIAEKILERRPEDDLF